MTNKRYFKRYRLSAEGKMYLNTGLVCDFKLMDISANGVFIETKEDIEIGSKVKLDIDINRHLMEIVNINAIVVRKISLHGKTLIGFKFVELPQEFIIHLDESLRFYYQGDMIEGFHSGEKRFVSKVKRYLSVS